MSERTLGPAMQRAAREALCSRSEGTTWAKTTSKGANGSAVIVDGLPDYSSARFHVGNSASVPAWSRKTLRSIRVAARLHRLHEA